MLGPVCSLPQQPSAKPTTFLVFSFLHSLEGPALLCVFPVVSATGVPLCLHMWTRYACWEVLTTFSSVYSTWLLLTSWKDIDSHIHLPVHPCNFNEFLLLSLVVFPWCWCRSHFLVRFPSYREPTGFGTQSWSACPMAWWKSVVMGGYLRA